MSHRDPQDEKYWNDIHAALQKRDEVKACQFLLMARQQYTHNLNQAGPEWCSSGFNWLRYMRVEAYELMEHNGTFKHWKAAKTDLPQAQMELIDIVIFALSYAIEQDSVESACRHMARAFTAVEHLTSEAVNINDACDDLVETSFHGAVNWHAIALLAVALEMDGDRLWLMYEGKMALNHVRHENGYGDGTYLKHWFGQEDNMVVQESVLDSATVMAKITSVGQQYVQRNLREFIGSLYHKAVEHHESR